MAETSHGIKRLLVVVGHYPSPYKPYYDTQLIDLLRSGCELEIVAAPPLDDAGHEKARTHGLVGRTSYYAVDLGSTPPRTFARLATRPLHALRFIARSNGAPVRRKAGDLLRSLALPRRKPDAVLVHGLGIAITFTWLRSWYPDIPMAMYYHGGEVNAASPHGDDHVERAFRAFDVVFTNTDFSRQQAISRGCEPGKLRVLPVGFDLADYQPATDRTYRKNSILRLVSVGRLSEEKGLDDALRALERVIASGRKSIRLDFAGDGYMREKLEARVRELGLQHHVGFLGALGAADVSATLAESDVLILPSYAHGTWTETQACAVQEAMLMKALVVTTQTGGVPESIPDTMRAFSVPERDVEGIARSIMSIYDMADEQIAALGESGRAFAERGYDIRDLNRQLLTDLWACSHTS